MKSSCMKGGGQAKYRVAHCFSESKFSLTHQSPYFYDINFYHSDDRSFIFASAWFIKFQRISQIYLNIDLQSFYFTIYIYR